jgi:hypothetical protein
MGVFGEIIGSGLGQAGGQYFGGDEGRRVGGTVGGALGGLLPFKKGGRIKGGKKGTPKPILAHVGEYVLPVGVKPTKAQIKAVANRHKR